MLVRRSRDVLRTLVTTLHFARRLGLAMLHATDLLDRAAVEIFSQETRQSEQRYTWCV